MSQKFFCVTISITLPKRASWTLERWADPSPLAEEDPNQIRMLLTLRLVNNLITSFAASSLANAFHLIWNLIAVVWSHICENSCLPDEVVLKKSLAPKSRYCRKWQTVAVVCAVVGVQAYKLIKVCCGTELVKRSGNLGFRRVNLLWIKKKKYLSKLAIAWMNPYFAIACICKMLRAPDSDFSKGCGFWACPRIKPIIIWL